jgi:hypothetical protein
MGRSAVPKAKDYCYSAAALLLLAGANSLLRHDMELGWFWAAMGAVFCVVSIRVRGVN